MKKIGLVALAAMFVFAACGKKVKPAVEEVAPEVIVVEEVVAPEVINDSTVVVEEVVEEVVVAE